MPGYKHTTTRTFFVARFLDSEKLGGYFQRQPPDYVAFDPTLAHRFESAAQLHSFMQWWRGGAYQVVRVRMAVESFWEVDEDG